MPGRKSVIAGLLLIVAVVWGLSGCGSKAATGGSKELPGGSSGAGGSAGQAQGEVQTPAELEKPTFQITYKVHRESDQTRILGEVVNTSKINAENVQVTFRFYDKSGGLVDTQSETIPLSRLAAGQKSSFGLATKETYAKVEFEATGDPSDKAFYDALKVLSVKYKPPVGAYSSMGEGVGEVQNAGAVKVSTIHVAWTFYDAKGDVIGSENAWPVKSELDPGQKTSFKATLFNNAKEVKKYVVQVSNDAFAQ
jgi:hypothetical protein